MTLEKQVTNLELSTKLKELGVKQESYFYWDECNYDDGNGCIDTIVDLINLDHLNMRGGVRSFHTSAFTATELLEMLPWELGGKILQIQKGNDCYVVYYEKNNIGAIIDNISIEYKGDINLCNALAKMLIYFIENNLIK